LIASSIAADVAVTWSGTCNGGIGFGFTFAAVSGGEVFKPDGQNGNMVPCNEYFEVSFSFVDLNGNIIDFPDITGQGTLYSVNNPLDTNGIVTIQMIPEVGGWGSGFVSTTGAVTVSTGQPFTFTCNNNVGNILIRTNYMLTATNDGGNPNYARTLDTVTDGGSWGSGLVITPPANPAASFGVGQSQCVNAQFVTTFSYPASGTSGITNTIVTAQQQTTAQQQQTTAQQQQTTAQQQQTTAQQQQTTAQQQQTSANNQVPSSNYIPTSNYVPPPPPVSVPFVPIIQPSDASSVFSCGILILSCLFLMFF
jgi:hypothetical protein